MVCSSVLLLIHGPIVMFVLGGVTGLVLANSETDLVMPGVVNAAVTCSVMHQAHTGHTHSSTGSHSIAAAHYTARSTYGATHLVVVAAPTICRRHGATIYTAPAQ